MIDSQNKTITTEYKYPLDFQTTEPYTSMIPQNIVSPVIEKITKQGTTEIARVKTNYWKDTNKTNGLILPLSGQSSYQSGSLVTEYTCDLYDAKGNILQVTGKDGVSTTYLWGYKGQYPIAEIKNATYSNICKKIGNNNETAGKTTLDNIAQITELTIYDLEPVHNLRNQLPDAQVSIYTYKPLVGIIMITDPRGVKTTYEYDLFGRLERIIDKNVKTIEEYEYHYKNQ